jgi:rhodanese-related sulfurtransferase
MKPFLASMLALLALLAAGPMARAMTVEVRGNLVFATGAVEDDLRKFQRAFAEPGVDTLVLVNSPGGDLWTALTIGRLVADKGYKTVTAGICHSACSIIFMGGRERRFADTFRPASTMVGIHGAHDSTTKTIHPVVQPQIFAFYKMVMGERFNGLVMNQALYQMDDAGAFLRVPESTRNANAMTVHCRSEQTPRKDCTEFRGETALSLGVITHTDLVRLDLPEAFKVAARVLGRELDTRIEDMPAFLADVVARKCQPEACKTGVGAWAGRPENRSLAIRNEGPGVGAAWDQNSPVFAMARAIYDCNHASGGAIGLCEAQAVNGFDVRPLYRQSELEHRQALDRLVVPKDRFYSNEEFGGAFTSAGGYRVLKLDDITPQRLEGVRTVGTQELARLLKSGSPPYVIDAMGGANAVLPGSATLVAAGVAYDDPVRDNEYNTRFLALLGLLAPDRSRPIVFYCLGRNCWNAVNAALRARNGGYSNVLWYRGGIESWRAAQLPTALIAVRAIAN